jgi:hypothetical protein
MSERRIAYGRIDLGDESGWSVYDEASRTMIGFVFRAYRRPGEIIPATERWCWRTTKHIDLNVLRILECVVGFETRKAAVADLLAAYDKFHALTLPPEAPPT